MSALLIRVTTSEETHGKCESEKKYWLEDVSLLFRGLVHCYHGEKHGNMQADMVLKKELRVVQFDPQATGSELCTTWDVI